jgi:NAD(P)-dependent dehydrogenase (short-subunit alcohol dehydrogenase family)
MPGGLHGQHAVVTGGGSGIGGAIAHALGEEGAHVTVFGRNRARLDAQAERLAALTEAQPIEVDVTSPESVARGFAQARERFGPPSILVNSAGQAAAAPFLETDVALLWKQMLDVNLTGTFLCTQAALPGMLEQRYGRIVNVASTAGLTGYRYVTAYCASKHGVVGLTRALALEVAKKNITVNAVCPGYTDTAIVDAAVANIAAKTGRSEQAAREELVRANPQGRLLRPEEVANAVLWLCLPGSDAVTGQAISVSGGEVT